MRDEAGESRWDHDAFTWRNPNRNDSCIDGASMGRRAGDFSVKSLRRLNVGFYNLGNGRMIHQWQLIPKAMPAMVREDSLTVMRIPYEYRSKIGSLESSYHVWSCLATVQFPSWQSAISSAEALCLADSLILHGKLHGSDVRLRHLVHSRKVQ